MTARCFGTVHRRCDSDMGSAAKTKTTSSLHGAGLAYSTVMRLFFFCRLGVLLTGDPMCLVSPRNGDPFPQRIEVKLLLLLYGASNRVQVLLDPVSACQWHTPCSSFVTGMFSLCMYVPYLNPQYSARTAARYSTTSGRPS
jgi:hypothetical protein